MRVILIWPNVWSVHAFLCVHCQNRAAYQCVLAGLPFFGASLVQTRDYFVEGTHYTHVALGLPSPYHMFCLTLC